jgi:hypothetical protein
MKPKQRIRTVGSVSNELIKKSREAALAAVQVFNNPAITFKSEIFVVMMVISWTYLLHAHFRKQGIEFIKADSELAKDVNKHYAVVKETEKAKYLPRQVVEKMQLSGFPRFSMHSHTQLWKTLDGKNPSKKLGVLIVKTWYWYEPWIELVAEHCFDNAAVYS